MDGSEVEISDINISLSSEVRFKFHHGQQALSAYMGRMKGVLTLAVPFSDSNYGSTQSFYDYLKSSDHYIQAYWGSTSPSSENQVNIKMNGRVSRVAEIDIVPKKIRIPVYIVIIASFVTIADLVMAGFAPALHKSLGIFVPLIVVNCIILGRAEAFASKNNIGRSIFDAIGMGIGFTLTLTIIGFFRELLGDGKILGTPVFGTSFEPVLLFILPPGAFLSLGFLIGILNWYEAKRVK